MHIRKLLILQKHRLNLPPFQRGIQRLGDLGKISYQTGGLSFGIVLPEGDEIVMLSY